MRSDQSTHPPGSSWLLALAPQLSPANNAVLESCAALIHSFVGMLFAESSHSRLKNTPARRSGHPPAIPDNTHARTHAGTPSHPIALPVRRQQALPQYGMPARCGSHRRITGLLPKRHFVRLISACHAVAVRQSHTSRLALRGFSSRLLRRRLHAPVCVCICSRLARVTSESDVSIVRRRHARRVAAVCPWTSARLIGCDWSGSRNTPGR